MKHYLKVLTATLFLSVVLIGFVNIPSVKAQTPTFPNPTTPTFPNPTTGNQPTTNNKLTIKFENPFKHETIPALINAIIKDILMPIGIVVAVLMIMYAGFKYVTAQGDTGKIKDARNALLYAVIGAAILLGASIISEVVQNTVNQFRV